MSLRLSTDDALYADPVETFLLDLSCPECGELFNLRAIERPTDSVRRAQLACPACVRMFRLTVTLVRTPL